MIPKFRAWDKEADTMHDVTSIWFDRNNEQYKLGHVSFPSQETVDTIFDNFELMQSTGLKDKNGVEIFEGDIVKIIGDVLGDDMSVIRFTEGGFYLDYKNLDTEFELLYSIDLPIEIIGNIYENPELLEDKNEK
ncbi:MAG: YopX family protein [Enterococcus avium]